MFLGYGAVCRKPGRRRAIDVAMKVYFLRHGIAGERSEWKGDDAARPLTEEGVERTGAVAAALARLDLGVGVIVTSPLVRARQTADIVARALDLGSKVIEDRRLGPGFNADKLRAILLDHRNDDVLVVGHEPDFSETVAALIGGGDLAVRKAGLALVELSGPDATRGRLLWLVPPKILTRIRPSRT